MIWIDFKYRVLICSENHHPPMQASPPKQHPLPLQPSRPSLGLYLQLLLSPLACQHTTYKNSIPPIILHSLLPLTIQEYIGIFNRNPYRRPFQYYIPLGMQLSNATVDDGLTSPLRSERQHPRDRMMQARSRHSQQYNFPAISDEPPSSTDRQYFQALRQSYLSRKNAQDCQIINKDDLMFELLVDLKRTEEENEAMRKALKDTRTNENFERGQAMTMRGGLEFFASNEEENEEIIALRTGRVKRLTTFEVNQQGKPSPKRKPPSPLNLQNPLALPDLSSTENIEEQLRTQRDLSPS